MIQRDNFQSRRRNMSGREALDDVRHLSKDGNPS